MLRLRLRSFLRQRGFTETELSNAVAEALLESGVTVSERFLRYLTENTEPITPDNEGKTPSLLKLGFIIRGLRYLTGEAVTVSDVLEYVVEKGEVVVPRKPAVPQDEDNEEPPSSPSTKHEIVLLGDDGGENIVLDNILELAVQRLQERGFPNLGAQLATLTFESRGAYTTGVSSETPMRKAMPLTLLVLLLASLSYIGIDHFILKPLQFERFTRLISFRDRVRPTSALPVPTLIGPEGDIDQLTPVLRISEVPGASAYEFYVENLVSNDGAYSGPVPNNSYPVPQDTLCPNTTYEWRARALGDDGWTSFSSPVYFSVTEEAAAEAQRDLVSLAEVHSKPAIPSIVAPVGSTNTTTPTLQVEFEPNIYGYGYYIRDLNTDKIVYDNNFATSNEIQVPEGVLEDGGVYQWNTRSRNCHFWSDFTEAQLFTANVND